MRMEAILDKVNAVETQRKLLLWFKQTDEFMKITEKTSRNTKQKV
jgi:hypothetical protein